MYIALFCRYFAGKYAGSGGRGDEGGIERIVVCVRIVESEGRGTRSEVIVGFGVYMPSPITFSGFVGSSVVVELFPDATRV